MQQQVLDYTNGDLYEGNTLGSMRHGWGKHSCTNGDTYNGYWRLDKRHGRGRAVFARGVEYEGEWASDKADGTGSVRYENGGVYEGGFSADVRQGWGAHSFPDGSRYEGEWASDKMHGKGRLTAQDGSYYEGAWEAGERMRGREWADGSLYEGAWAAGARCGAGRLTTPRGEELVGTWEADTLQGIGYCRTDAGDRFRGGWVKGVREGLGVCMYACGDRYEGAWAAGVRSGKGTCVYASGDAYQGDWADDKRHGQGTCRFADGTVFRGEWEADAWVQSLAEPKLCRAKGLGLSRALAGSPGTFEIKARDEQGNKRLCGGDTFAVRLEGPRAVTGSVEDREDGTYAARYCTTFAGSYQLHVTNDAGEPVAESPYPLRVLPGRPEPRRCTLCGAGRRAAVAGAAAEFCVEARDCHGNRCLDAALEEGLPLEVELSSGAHSCEVVVSRQGNGCWLCVYTPPAPGFYRLELRSCGVPLGGSPFSVQMHPDVPVVTDMADMWKVTKLQNERKRRLAQEQVRAKMTEDAAAAAAAAAAGGSPDIGLNGTS
ncbi:hypothetical protein WJX81_000327 [Elliptochloris bilobata]|uniref:Uncharacterized protein n=1 Tax=Elliptochloris bilobata TaxID=381761 RepID=A0AAW1S983_9CHLO